MRQFFAVIFAGIFALLVAFVPVQAETLHQDEQSNAAVLEVTFTGLEFRRVNTQNWIPLRVGSKMPIGAGDQLRTNEHGRAILSFGANKAQALVMPSSHVLLDYFLAEDAFNLDLTVMAGRVIFTVDTANITEFRIAAGDTIVTEPSPHFGLQVDNLLDVVSLISAEGDLGVQVADEMISIPAEHGLRVRADQQLDPITALTFPYNFAKLDGVLDGCPATINTNGEMSLNVRVGANIEYDALGSVPHNTPVYLMAISPNNERYRIQFFSGFGWVLATGVTSACVDLPVIPYGTPETVLQVERPRRTEIEFLYPFFGDPRQNVIFYILPEN